MAAPERSGIVFFFGAVWATVGWQNASRWETTSTAMAYPARSGGHELVQRWPRVHSSSCAFILRAGDRAAPKKPGFFFGAKDSP